MNFFFFLANGDFQCELNIPRFQNRGKFFDKKIVLYKCNIKDELWEYSELTNSNDEHFWNLSSQEHSIDSIFFIEKK